MYVERRPVATIVFFALAPSGQGNRDHHSHGAVGVGIALPAAAMEDRRTRVACACIAGAGGTRSRFCCAWFRWRLWFAYHHHRTGFYFGNPEYLRYNLQATLSPLRIVLAMLDPAVARSDI